jgi:TolA-binding protein
MRASRLAFIGALILVAGLSSACGGDAERRARIESDRRYAAAERAFSQKRHDEAERLFVEVAQADPTAETQALAAYRRAQMREREGRVEEATALYAEAEQFEGTERAAFAAWRKARLLAEQPGRGPEGRAALQRMVEAHPSASGADKAVKYLAVRRRPDDPLTPADEHALVQWMLDAAERFKDRSVGDNLLFYAAWLQVQRGGDVGGARNTLLRLTQRYYVSPLLDDALWLLATLERRQGRVDAAIATCEALLHVREDQNYVLGGYRSKRLDDAGIAIGWMHLHLRHDAAAAERAFRRMLDEFPTSVFRDDAFWGLALAQVALKREADARATLRTFLDELPGSRYAKTARKIVDGAQGWPPPDPSPAASALLNPQGRGGI